MKGVEPHVRALRARADEVKSWEHALRLDPSGSYLDEDGDVLKVGYAFRCDEFGENDYDKVTFAYLQVSAALKTAAIRAGLQTFSQGKKNPMDRNMVVKHFCSHRKRNYAFELPKSSLYTVHMTPQDQDKTM